MAEGGIKKRGSARVSKEKSEENKKPAANVYTSFLCVIGLRGVLIRALL